MVERPGFDRLVPEPCEFGVRLSWGEDPDFVSQEELWKWDEPAIQAYSSRLDRGNKLGGTPSFLQGDEFPGDGEHRRY